MLFYVTHLAEQLTLNIFTNIGKLSKSISVSCPGIRIAFENTTKALEKFNKPDNVNWVKNEARRDEDVPKLPKAIAVGRTIDAVDLEPIRRNGCNASKKERCGHDDGVKQKEARFPWVAHHIKKPPGNIIDT